MTFITKNFFFIISLFDKSFPFSTSTIHYCNIMPSSTRIPLIHRLRQPLSINKNSFTKHTLPFSPFTHLFLPPFFFSGHNLHIADYFSPRRNSSHPALTCVCMWMLMTPTAGCWVSGSARHVLGHLVLPLFLSTHTRQPSVCGFN